MLIFGPSLVVLAIGQSKPNSASPSHPQKLYLSDFLRLLAAIGPDEQTSLGTVNSTLEFKEPVLQRQVQFGAIS